MTSVALLLIKAFQKETIQLTKIVAEYMQLIVFERRDASFY